MEKFYYVNTHLDHVGRVARKEGLNLILEKIQKINPDNLPLILTGDFNMEHTDSSIQKLNEKMIDARTSAKKTDSFGIKGLKCVRNTLQFEKNMQEKLLFLITIRLRGY